LLEFFGVKAKLCGFGKQLCGAEGQKRSFHPTAIGRTVSSSILSSIFEKKKLI